MGAIQQLSIYDLFDPAQAEIDRESARWYVHAVHDDDRGTDAYIICAEKQVRGSSTVWNQRGYTWTELLKHMRKLHATSHKDTYLSLQTFCAPRRRAETLWRLNAIAYDIDAHASDDPMESISETLGRMDRDVFQPHILPYPSMIISTGRGLQVVYLLESLPKQGLPLWRLVGEAMAERIRTCLGEYVTQAMQLDPNHSDVTRVLRLPGTYNTAARRYAKVLLPADLIAEPARYRLDELRDAYLPELIIPARKRRDETQTMRDIKRGKLVHLFNAYSLHVARLDDLITLVEMRHGCAIAMDGRRRMVFLYRYWSCFYVGPDCALEAALEFNARFYEPLPERVVRQDTASAERAYARWQEDRTKGYNYRNGTLIRLLEITEDEQRELKTIIGKEEKKRRQKEKNWYNDKRDTARAWGHGDRDTERASSKREVDGRILQYLMDDNTYNEIARKLKVSRQRVQRVAKENGVLRGRGKRTDRLQTN